MHACHTEPAQTPAHRVHLLRLPWIYLRAATAAKGKICRAGTGKVGAELGGGSRGGGAREPGEAFRCLLCSLTKVKGKCQRLKRARGCLECHRQHAAACLTGGVGLKRGTVRQGVDLQKWVQLAHDFADGTQRTCTRGGLHSTAGPDGSTASARLKKACRRPLRSLSCLWRTLNMQAAVASSAVAAGAAPKAQARLGALARIAGRRITAQAPKSSRTPAASLSSR